MAATPSAARLAVPAHLAEHEDDENGAQRGYVRGTDFSLPYFSRWSRMHDPDIRSGLLRHINCGYLSTYGIPPTLLALKQHAQSLCALIHALNPTLKSGEILADDPTTTTTTANTQATPADPLTVKYQRNDAFDFLADLSVVYTNDDPNHHKPLTGLLNEVKARHEAYGTNYHCPFAETEPRAQGEKQRPYANHHALIMHANACLERIDHEYSSTGGLLSMLPTADEEDEVDLASARNSLLGQWLLFTQHLVGRMHELERAYGNAVDALAGEASIPQQYVGKLGPDERSGRELVHPQDRWVLVNAGDDVFEHVHSILDKQEALVEEKAKAWDGAGAVGAHVWRELRNGPDYARGIVPVTLPTRYYRIAGRGGHHTLFVLPAWKNHPGVTYSKEIEQQPTVVASVQPQFPARVTELEQRYNERIRNAATVEQENAQMRGAAVDAQAQTQALREQTEQLARTRDALLLAVDVGAEQLAVDVQTQRERADQAEVEMQNVQVELGQSTQDLDTARAQLQTAMTELAGAQARVEELERQLQGLGQTRPKKPTLKRTPGKTGQPPPTPGPTPLKRATAGEYDYGWDSDDYYY